MSFFKKIGKGLAKVGKAIGGTVGKLAHGVVSQIPLVGAVYKGVTNVIGKDLGDLGSLLQGVKATNSNPITPTNSANAEELHQSLQLDSGKTTGFEVHGGDSKLVSFAATPSYDGTYLTGGSKELAFDTNPLLTPAAIQSGATNEQIVDALSKQGINPAAVQVALTGDVPRGRVDLSSILDIISGTAGVVKDSVVKPVSPVSLGSSNNTPLLVGAGVLGALGLGYVLFNK